MPHTHIRSPEDAEGLRRELRSAAHLALDCEAAGFHRYSDRLCLIQISTDLHTYVLDPLAFDPSDLLREYLERADARVLMHGADFDLRLLRRDLGIRLRGLFDTQIAAQILGEESFGLSALLESRLGVRLSKKFQRADWAQRPLSPGMLEYAADDTRYLIDLATILEKELAAAGRTAWAEEECRALEAAIEVAAEPTEPEDPVTRVRGARKLPPRQVTALRAALGWRDAIARRLDRAPFRVVSDGPLIEAAMTAPAGVPDLLAIKGFPDRMARSEGEDLVRRLKEVADLPEGELRPYPKPAKPGRRRATQETDELLEKLKAIRNRRAAEIGLPRGTLLANAVVLAVARAKPKDADDLAAVEGMRHWKAEILGADFLAAIRRGP